jgi:hypothetical protein
MRPGLFSGFAFGYLSAIFVSKRGAARDSDSLNRSEAGRRSRGGRGSVASISRKRRRPARGKVRTPVVLDLESMAWLLGI